MRVLEICDKDDINEAINRLDSAPSVLKLQPGIYEQDIQLRCNLTIEGAGIADLGFTIVKGSHLFPTEGCVGLKNIKFINHSHIFTAAPKSKIEFLFHSCALEVKNGWALYLPEVVGRGIFFDGWIYGDENGFINNENGSVNFKIVNITSESASTTLPIILNSSSYFFNVHVKQPMILKNCRTQLYNFAGGNCIESTVIRED